jgi:2-dehydropantoate 2-reductase
MMHVAILGAGAVGGYIGAKLARAGERVTFLARDAQARTLRERGMTVRSPLGDFTVRVEAEEEASRVENVDLVIFTVKTYDTTSAVPMLPPMLGASTVVLTLQNGVDSVDQIAAAVGQGRVLGGAAYIATCLAEPGVIEQTGTHRRIVFGEVFGERSQLSPRVREIADAIRRGDLEAEPVPDARVALWKKFIYLAPMAGFSAAARVPVGPLRSQPQFRDVFGLALGEVESVARAEGITVPADVKEEIFKYVEEISPAMRASMLIDLSQGKRIEVEALLGSVVRRGRASGVPTPILATLYTLLKPYETGPWVGAGPSFQQAAT